MSQKRNLIEHNGFVIRVVDWNNGFIAWSTRREEPETAARVGHWHDSLDAALGSAKALIDAGGHSATLGASTRAN